MKKQNTKLLILNLIFLLSFFPFFRLIPIGNVETQPFAAIFAIAYLVSYKASKLPIKLPKLPLRVYILLIFVYFIAGFLRYFLSASNGDYLLGLFQSFLIFLAPLSIFVSLFNNLELISAETFRLCLYPWLITSILQAYFPYFLSAIGLDQLLAALIPRFTGSTLGGSRGVVALSPEPSYSAQIIVVMLAFSIYLYRAKKVKKNEFYWLITSCLIMSFLNLSATIAVFILCFSIFYMLSSFITVFINMFKGKSFAKNITGLLLGTLVALCAVSLLIFLPSLVLTFLPNSRFSDMIISISSLHSTDLFSFLDFTNQLGSIRSISAYVGYFNAFHTFGIGSGLGSWSVSFFDSLQSSGLDPSKIDFFIFTDAQNMKPYAYGSLVSFDMGFLGLIPLSSIFIGLILRRLSLKPKVSEFAWACLGTSMLMLYFNSISSLPSGWLLFLFFLHDRSVLISSSSSKYVTTGQRNVV